MLNRLEDSLTNGADNGGAEVEEGELLQSTAPGPFEKEGKEVEDVLSIISQSIYRAGEGNIIIVFGMFLALQINIDVVPTPFVPHRTASRN
jgi:hypothetical protein